MIRVLALTPALALGLALVGCQERLTQPGECPALCPGGTPEVLEEVLEAIPQLDSTFTGYAERGAGQVLLVSGGAPTALDTNLAVVVFVPRPEEIRFRDTLRTYTVDSIRLGIGLIAHDTAVNNLRFELYRLPSTLDTTTLTYAGVRDLLSGATPVATVAVPDTALRGPQTVMLRGAQVDPLALGPADGGRLRLAISAVGDAPTGARIGQRNSLVPTTFETFVTPIVANTAPERIEVGVEFDSYVSSVGPVSSPDLLAVGGTPASRSLVRFPLPLRLRDSASVVRATLELVPAAAIRGLPNDPAALEVRALTTDLGAKSPASPLSLGTRVLSAGGTGTVEVEIGQLVRLWQGPNGLPSTLVLQISPEAATFTEVAFGSTRLGTVPRLRLEYLRAFPFERP
jgi:hypothetical protein